MKEIEQLIEVSRYYGSQKDYVIAGGGNTSFKDEKKLYVKASGVSLATIDENGFAVLDRQAMTVISEKTYSQDVMERENQIKYDLLNARLHPEKGLRPSVEASLHNLIDYRFVVHTHHTKVNGLMCSTEAESLTKELFGHEVVYVPYVDPGYILFKEVESRILSYRKKTGKEPHIILLQNHGIFVAADTVDEIHAIYKEVIATIDPFLQDIYPIESLPVNPAFVKILPAIRMMLSSESLKTVKLINNTLIDRFLASEEEYSKIALPFIPDGIVYCNSSFIYAELTDEPETLLVELSEKIQQYIKTQPKAPKILFIKGMGCILASDHAQGIATLEEVIMDTLAPRDVHNNVQSHWCRFAICTL